MNIFKKSYLVQLCIMVAFSIPIFVLLSISLKSYQQQIALTQMELVGVQYLEKFKDLYFKILVGESDHPAETSSVLNQFETSTKDLRAQLNLDPTSLLKNQSADVSPDIIIVHLRAALEIPHHLPSELRQDLAFRAANLIGYIGDHSTLVLDPNLDTYHLMNVVVAKIPHLFAIFYHPQTQIEDIQYEVNLIQKSIKTSITSDEESFGTSPSLGPQLTQKVKAVDGAMNRYHECLEKTPLGCRKLELTNTLFDLWRSALQELKTLLTMRSEQIRTEQWRISILTIVCWAALLILSIFAILREQKINQIILNQQATLMNSSRLAILGESAASIGHEINSSLSIIIGLTNLNLKLMERKNLPDTAFRELLLKIQKSAQRIVKIIAGIKSMSRDSTNEPMVTFDLNEVILDVIDITQDRLTNASILLNFNESPDSHVIGNSVQIFQVFSNLINNSIDAISSLPEKWIRISCHTNNQFIQIILTDSGGGIPSEIADKIMDPFFTTKPVGKGTGLGLAISSRIAKEHGGTLKLISESPNTEFVLELPKAPPTGS